MNIVQSNQIESSTTYARNIFYLVFVDTRGGPNRTRLMQLLRRDQLTRARIAKLLGLNYLTIQYHLQVLERNNLVIHTDEKQNAKFSISTFFEINSKLFDEICRLTRNDSKQSKFPIMHAAVKNLYI